MIVPGDQGVYAVGTGSTGVAETFLVLGFVYFVVMLLAAFSYRIPAPGWQPAGWTPPDEQQSDQKMISQHHVSIEQAMRTPQFYLVWIVLCFNVTAGIGVLGVAKTMMSEIFQPTLPNIVNDNFAATYVLMISVFNMLGRFFWASASDYLGRKPTYTIFFLQFHDVLDGGAVDRRTGGEHLRSTGRCEVPFARRRTVASKSLRDAHHSSKNAIANAAAATMSSAWRHHPHVGSSSPSLAAWGIEGLKRFIPTAAVFKLDVQVFRVEPEQRHGGQEFPRSSRFILLLLRTDRFRPTLIDAVAETQSAFITELEDGFCKVLVNLDRNKVSSKSIFTGHGHFPSGRSPNGPAGQAEESRQ